MKTWPASMPPTRAGARTVPRREATSITSPSPMPSSDASASLISTKTSGAASCNSGARGLRARVPLVDEPSRGEHERVLFVRLLLGRRVVGGLKYRAAAGVVSLVLDR